MNNENPWILRKIVLPQHADHAGVMWHGSYLSWLEEARVDALSKVGLSYSKISESGYEMAVVDIHIRYMKSINHGDAIILKSWSLEKKGIKLPWKTIFQGKNEKPFAEAIVSLVMLKRLGSELRIVRKIPDHILKALNKLRSGP